MTESYIFAITLVANCALPRYQFCRPNTTQDTTYRIKNKIYYLIKFRQAVYRNGKALLPHYFALQ